MNTKWVWSLEHGVEVFPQCWWCWFFLKKKARHEENLWERIKISNFPVYPCMVYCYIYDAFNSRSKSSFKHGKLLIVYRNFEIKKGFSSIWICLNETEMFYEIGSALHNPKK